MIPSDTKMSRPRARSFIHAYVRLVTFFVERRRQRYAETPSMICQNVLAVDPRQLFPPKLGLRALAVRDRQQGINQSLVRRADIADRKFVCVGGVSVCRARQACDL